MANSTAISGGWPLDGSQLMTGPLRAIWWRLAQDNPALTAPSAWARAPEFARGFG
jgi:hypothetical protein